MRSSKHAGDRPGENHAQIAREIRIPATTRPRAGIRERQAEHRDVIEVVADFADDLAGPREAVVAVGAKQAEEVPDSSQTGLPPAR